MAQDAYASVLELGLCLTVCQVGFHTADGCSYKGAHARGDYSATVSCVLPSTLCYSSCCSCDQALVAFIPVDCIAMGDA